MKYYLSSYKLGNEAKQLKKLLNLTSQKRIAIIPNAADFIGADLRDADLRGANLSTSMFLTQMQINSAKGDEKTLLPFYIRRPSHWTA